MSDQPRDTTELLLGWRQGDASALDELLPRLENELRRLARHHLSHERPDHSLQSVELVNEAYLRLVRQRDVKNRTQFFALAARLMRRILANHARDRNTDKRGGKVVRIALTNAASIAGLVLTTDTLVTNLPDDTKKNKPVEGAVS